MNKGVKLSLIICFFTALPAMAQNNYATKGLFTFSRVVPIPGDFDIGPGQVNKDGSSFFVGLTDGDLENMVDLHSDLYRVNLTPDAAAIPITGLEIPNAIDSMRFFQASASDNDAYIVFVVNAWAGWNDNELAIVKRQPSGAYGQMRLLTELNKEHFSDAYPWLSGDANRLYYAQDFTLMYAERNHPDSLFSAPKPVDFVGEVKLEIVSAWLPPDEKTIFLLANNRIYKATRKSTSEPFSFPTLWTDEFKDFYFVSGLSFAPDKKSMYIYYSDEQTQQILEYKLTKGKVW